MSVVSVVSDIREDRFLGIPIYERPAFANPRMTARWSLSLRECTQRTPGQSTALGTTALPFAPLLRRAKHALRRVETHP